jgi:hypothetical protein
MCWSSYVRSFSNSLFLCCNAFSAVATALEELASDCIPTDSLDAASGVCSGSRSEIFSDCSGDRIKDSSLDSLIFKFENIRDRNGANFNVATTLETIPGSQVAP